MKPSFSLLPPRALLLSLLVQIPLMVWLWRPKLGPIVVGLVLLVAGVVLNIWADWLFQKSRVGVHPFSPVSTLMKGGPFRLTRNPMYLGMVLVSASAPLLTGVYLNFWAVAILALWLHLGFILPEEKFLDRQLGAEYRKYARTAPRWLPLLPSFFGPQGAARPPQAR